MEHLGKVEIAPEVIEIIAGLAASEVNGVYSMSGGVVDDIGQLLGRKNFRQGVKVNFEENTSIEVNLIAEYGINIPEMGKEVQNRVKEAVENMTGIVVEQVWVLVEGIKVVQSEEEEPMERVR